MPKSRLEAAIAEAASRFATAIITLLRGATIEELAGLGQSAPEAPRRRPGRPRKALTTSATTTAPTVSEATPGPSKAEDARQATADRPAATEPKVKPTRKKRHWPTCTVEGCGKNAYGPSKGKYCYAHHVERGGDVSPFAKRKAKAKAESAKEAAPTKRRTIRRKAGETRPTEAQDAGQASIGKTDSKKAAEIRAELERGGKS